MNSTTRKTLFEMLEDRQYKFIQDIDDKTLLFQEHEKTILIYNTEEIKTGVKTIKFVIDILDEYNCKHLIFIYKQSITIFAKNLLDELLENGMELELFCEKELSYNVTRHELVPKHEAISNEEANKLFEKFKCNITQFPVLLFFDPISKYYGFQKGQIVKITRKSETNGEHIMYRQVL